MTTVKDIFEYTESFAPVSTAADFDNCGILVGDKNALVTKALVTLDITPETVEEARSLGCELIISHHPVIFSPLKSLSSESVPYLLAKHGITALCLHTNLDIAVEGGINVCLASALGLHNIRMYPEQFLAFGELKEEMSSKEFALHVKKSLGCEAVSYTEGKDSIKTVAMCSGSGGDFYGTAVDMGADAFLTGEAKHHEQLAAKNTGVTMVVAGHFHTEDVAIAPLASKLAEKFPSVQFLKSREYTAPARFV